MFFRLSNGCNTEGGNADGETFDFGEGIAAASQGSPRSHYIVNQQYMLVLQLFRMYDIKGVFYIFMSLVTPLHTLFLGVVYTLQGGAIDRQAKYFGHATAEQFALIVSAL